MIIRTGPNPAAGGPAYLGRVIKGTFRKHERLRGRTRMQALIKGGRGMSEAPIRLVSMSMPLPSQVAVQAAFAVPKRHMKRAVHRNRVKRLMREAYRGEKQRLNELFMARGEQCALLFIYQSGDVLAWPEVQGRISRLVDRLIQGHAL